MRMKVANACERESRAGVRHRSTAPQWLTVHSDPVSWNSEAGRVHGTIKKNVTTVITFNRLRKNSIYTQHVVGTFHMVPMSKQVQDAQKGRPCRS